MIPSVCECRNPGNCLRNKPKTVPFFNGLMEENTMGHERFRSSHFKEQRVVSLQKAIRPLCESGKNPFENGSVPLPPTWHLGLKARTPALQAGKDGFNSRRCYYAPLGKLATPSPSQGGDARFKSGTEYVPMGKNFIKLGIRKLALPLIPTS